MPSFCLMIYSEHSSVIYAIALSVLLWCSLCSGAGKQPSPDDIRLTPAVRAVASVYGSVVSIGTQETKQVNDGYERFYHEFYGQVLLPRQKTVRNYVPLGSGVIVNARGLIVTNNHVVRRARNLEIRLWNGKSFPARTVGFDEPNDLALLQLLPEKLGETRLQGARFGQPNDLLLGETVLTIGNPFGLDHSVSQGVLSAMHRSYESDDVPFDDILQTDAAINPGNSGGPLVNLKGEVIGINQAIRRGASGIGFAIPVKRIEEFLSRWLLPSRFSNGHLGLETPRRGKSGVVLGEMESESPAAQAGLKSGDEVVEVNGQPIRRLLDFGEALWQAPEGSAVSLRLSDGRQVSLKVTPMADDVLIESRLGLRVQTLTPDLCEAIDLPRDLRGVVINQLNSEPDFRVELGDWRQVFKRGDIIVKVDDTPIRSAQELAEQLRKRRTGDSVSLFAIVYDHDQSRLMFNKFQAILK